MTIEKLRFIRKQIDKGYWFFFLWTVLFLITSGRENRFYISSLFVNAIFFLLEMFVRACIEVKKRRCKDFRDKNDIWKQQ